MQTHTCACSSTHVRARTHAQAHTHAHTHACNTHACTYARTYARTHARTHIHAFQSDMPALIGVARWLLHEAARARAECFTLVGTEVGGRPRCTRASAPPFTFARACAASPGAWCAHARMRTRACARVRLWSGQRPAVRVSADRPPSDALRFPAGATSSSSTSACSTAAQRGCAMRLGSHSAL